MAPVMGPPGEYVYNDCMGYADKTEGSRLNMTLTKRASKELEEMQEEEGLSKTDLVCRSINLYRFATRELQHGSDLLIRDVDGSLMKIHIQ
jgi:hypothetical protein